MTLYTIRLSERLYKNLERQAAAEAQSVEQLVQEALSRQLTAPVPVESDLPALLQAELHAMERLSDAALWALARSSMAPAHLDRLEQLRLTAAERPLTSEETSARESLLREYDETILRRAHAATLLSERGYDMSDPTVLQDRE